MININSSPTTDKSWTSLQWDAISSAHRLQLLQFIEGAGKASIKELSAWTGRAGTSLYPHLEILEAAELVAVEVEMGRGRPRRIYRPGVAVGWSRNSGGTANSNDSAISLGVQLLSDLALRLRRWGKARGTKSSVVAGPDRSAALISETTWLDDDQREQVNVMVDELMAFVRTAREQRRGKRHNVAVYHFPDITLREARDGAAE